MNWLEVDWCGWIGGISACACLGEVGVFAGMVVQAKHRRTQTKRRDAPNYDPLIYTRSSNAKGKQQLRLRWLTLCDPRTNGFYRMGGRCRCQLKFGRGTAAQAYKLCFLWCRPCSSPKEANAQHHVDNHPKPIVNDTFGHFAPWKLPYLNLKESLCSVLYFFTARSSATITFNLLPI